MSAADLYDLELVWPFLDPTDVVVTGTFDNWSSSIHLVKGDDGFSATVKVPRGQKVAYKFIVDGRWRCRDDQPQENDGRGNMNNVLQTTPDMPQRTAAHDPPARLSIPLQGEGYSDAENMVTAVEFLPPAEIPRGSLPLAIPQITVDGVAQAPSADTSVSELRLNTAAATEGHVSPTSDIPAKLVPPKQTTLPAIDDDGLNGNGEAHDSSAASETAKDAELAPSESAVARPAQDAPALTDDVPPIPAPDMVLEPTPKQPRGDLVEPVAQGNQQTTTTASASIGQASTPESSTVTHKKRRSLFARIKHIFDKERKNKH